MIIIADRQSPMSGYAMRRRGAMRSMVVSEFWQVLALA